MPPPEQTTRSRASKKSKRRRTDDSDSDFTPDKKKKNEVAENWNQWKETLLTEPKKIPVVQGKLKVLFEIPIDIVYEILSHLDPIDLVQVSRSGKNLWAMLSSKSATSVWVAARSHIFPPLPDRPEDMSELQFADMMFGKGCQFCPKDTGGIIERSFYVRKRICSDCIPKHCTLREQVDSFTWLSRYYMLMPTVTLHLRSPTLFIPPVIYYFKDLCASWTQDPDRDLTIRRLQERYKYANICINWANRYAMHMVEDRKSRIAERVKALGWADEAALNSAHQQFENQWYITELCQQEIPLHIWSGLDSVINRYMEKLKKDRLGKERAAQSRTKLRPRPQTYTPYFDCY